MPDQAKAHQSGDGTPPVAPAKPIETVLAKASGRKRGSVATLATATYATTALGLVTAPLVARSIGPTGRGAYAAVMSYSTLAATVLGLGISLTVTRAVLSERRDPRLVLGACLRFCIYMLPFAAAFGVLVSASVLRDYTHAAKVAALVFVLIAPLGILQLCLISLLLSSGALGSLTKVRALPLVVNAVGVVGLAVVGELSLTNYLVVTFVGVLGTLTLSWKVVGLRPRSGLSVRPLLSFGLRAYPASLAYLANAQLDQMLIAPFLGPADLGRYAIAVTLSNVPSGLIQSMGARFQSEMTSDDGSLVGSAVAARTRAAVLIGAVGSLALAPLVPIMVPLLFGSGFGMTTPLCLVLLLGGIPQAIGSAANPALIFANRPGVASRAQIAGLVITAIGLAITLPTIGILGAAITTVLAYCGRAAVEVRALHQLGIRGFIPGSVEWVILKRRLGRLVLRRSAV